MTPRFAVPTTRPKPAVKPHRFNYPC
jgi:hypothetical protein